MPGIRRELGAVFRDDSALSMVGASNSWYTIRNSANSADLVLPITSTGSTFYIDGAVALWTGGANAYKQARILVGGSSTGVSPALWSVGYLLNGVSPASFFFKVDIPAGSYNVTLQLRQTNATTEGINYRGAFIRGYETL